ncbi:sugar ABC transporter permease [Streptomyces sp. NBC_01754]|uniref:carbohydrate ABC transporter permease n=1 Tax=Streptomyces sp. NBC_01754 TaxID=2975930 RepID=UPI002DDC3097|nr:sugar ABC transporter permease [Streptomyces sp. NBC_01754]WSC91311.1 sugar ABC transporter permease [Streptomyces sp. NBC_01754]
MRPTGTAEQTAAASKRTVPPGRRRGRETALGRRTLLLFGGPFVLLFAAMYIAPLLYATVSSLFVVERSGLGLAPPTRRFDPLHNFAQAFGDHDFLAGLARVGLFAVVQVPLMLGLALGLALLLDSRSARAKGFFRLGAFLPYAIPGVSAALVWSFMYSSQSSPINHLLEPLGIHIPFFANGAVLWSVANIVTWSWTGYNMIIIYSALQTIPAEVLEAAKMDGASALRTAWNIKIPAVRGSLVLTTVFSVIGSAQLFNEPAVLQPISSGAISSVFTPVMSAQAAVAAGNYPYAAAQSVVLAVAVGVLSFVFFKLTSRGENA